MSQDRTHPANRRFHFRWSTDPIVLATYQDLKDSPEAQALINGTPPWKTGDASAIRDSYHTVVAEARAADKPVWLSIREMETNRVISIEEIRLIAALFCESELPDDE
jgi:hypothetical protein